MITVLDPGDPGYPDALRYVKRPPTLRVRGALPVSPGVAIVGSRDASDEALAFTHECVTALVNKGFSIWSGGALGVDAAAHAASIACGAPTVVVLPSGLDVASPVAHADLFKRVLDAGGAHVSLARDDAPATLYRYHARNEVLAAFTIATLVIEAGAASGTRSTVAAARSFARPVLAVPHAPWDTRGDGCNKMIADGARMIRQVDDVLTALGVEPRGAAPVAQLTMSFRSTRDTALAPPRLSVHAHATPAPACALPQDLDDDARAVLKTLENEAICADVIVERSGLSPSRVAVALLTLTIGAVVVEEPVGSFRRASSFV